MGDAAVGNALDSRDASLQLDFEVAPPSDSTV